jgi:hypothetical protein
MVRRKLTIPERWQAVGMHNGGFSHRRVSASAVLNGRCRDRLDMSRSSLGVVLRGIPARGRSVTFPVGHMIIWGGLFAHGDGSTGLMKVVFCYALPTVVQRFGANETLHFRTTTFWAQLLMLYRVHVWRHRRPWNYLNSLLL